MRIHPVIVIGAGQAGLALSYALQQQQQDHLVLESHPEVGDNWRTRWDALSMFSPVKYNSLPGWPFPGERWSMPTKDQAADYLRDYARHFDLPVQTHTKVERLTKSGDLFSLTTNQGEFQARAVVLATGAYQTPRIPPIEPAVPTDLPQLHSSTYLRPDQLPIGPTLVVGAGASGQQIARDLVATRPVTLAGPDVMNLPRKFLGIDVYWWLYKSGLMRKTIDSKAGRKQKEKRNEATVGEDMKGLQQKGVRRVGKLTGFEGHTALFEEGERLDDVQAVVWATGYRNRYPWVELDMLGEDERPAHRRGVSTKVAGLYFVGLTYLYRMNSSLMGGVGEDALYLGEVIARSLR